MWSVAMGVSSSVLALSLPLVFPEAPSAFWFSRNGCVVRLPHRCDVFVGGFLVGSFCRNDVSTRNALLAGIASDPYVHLTRLAHAFDVSLETLRQLRIAYDSEGVLGVVGRRSPGRPSKVTRALRIKLRRAFTDDLSVSEAHEAVGRSLGRSTVGDLFREWNRESFIDTTPSSPDVDSAGCDSVDQLALQDATSLTSAPAAPVGVAEEKDAGCNAAISEVTPVEVSAEPLADEITAASQILGTANDLNSRSGRAPQSASAPVAAEPPAASSTALALPAPSSAHRSKINIAAPHIPPARVDPTDSAGGGSPEESKAAPAKIGARRIENARGVQHLGAWLMIAMLTRMGLYHHAEALCPTHILRSALRVAFDAVVIALSIGQRCVEGVRRLATPTARALLRASGPPSATWVRRILGGLAAHGRGEQFHVTMGLEYVRTANAVQAAGPSVFYVDNHLRPYTGKAVVRKGWRMQDKRVRPGITEYYVHDLDGRPVLRFDVPSHDSLTTWLSPIAGLLRNALGQDTQILLAFDRAGAFPEQMAELREEQFEFVTYERKPYPILPASAFQNQFSYDGEPVAWHELRLKNLGAGRGRVRRVVYRMADGHQVNLLSVSTQPPEKLYAIMRGRWGQENGFKHGVARWGINQLDGRQTEPYPPGTIIPNPARRRLDEAIRIERVREGRARRELARLEPGNLERARWQAEISEAVALQREFEAYRPAFPTHAPIEETDLDGKLVRHTGEYKALIDAVRIGAANAESELACILGGHLKRPAEAKRLLQNLMLAPGSVRVGATQITVALEPAGTKNELRALERLLEECTSWALTLPGDADDRPVRFELQK